MPQFQSIKTVPKINIESKDILSLVYTPGVGASCLKIEKNPDAAMVYTNKINSVAVISFDYTQSLKRALFLKSILSIDAYPLVVESCSVDDLKFALENIEINFCAFDLSLIQDFVKGVNFDIKQPVLVEPVTDLRDFFGAISRNAFMLDVNKLDGDNAQRSLLLHELCGGVIETELVEEKRRKFVAIVSDGSAVLGYGNIGALQSLPVMEGKAALYSEFADVDSMLFCIKSQVVDDIVKILSLFKNSFSAIHLEDICAPSCFELEKRLSEKLELPIFHDDQHGTAIIVVAGVLNALTLVKKELSAVKIVISGAGAAGSAVAKLLKFAGANNIILTDINGVVYKGRKSNDIYLDELSGMTNPNDERGELKDVIKNADVFIGVSKGGLLKPEMIDSMEYQPVVFALANPTPEIMPDVAKNSGAYIVATGRSDFENQVNNALAFPGLMKGVLDGNIKEITNDIKLECALVIASMVDDEVLAKDNIMPDALNRMIPIEISSVIIQKYGNSH